MALNFKAQQIEILTHKNSHVNVVRSCLETPEKKPEREREKSEKQAFANCRTRDDVAHSSFSCTLQFWSSGSHSRSPALLRHMILPNLICRSGPRALIMWLLAICHSCWTASKEASRASERTERSQRRQKISEHLIPFTYLNLIEIKF